MTRHELERIASLASHPGFHALLKLLDEADEVLLRKLEQSPCPNEIDHLNLWRASRRFKRIIEHRPEELYNELGNHLGDIE